MPNDVEKTETADQAVENTETSAPQPEEPKVEEPKTYTQQDVDKIVRKRLERDREKNASSYADVEAKRQEAEEALEKANSRVAELEAEKARNEAVQNVSKETGVPFDVVAMLSASDEDGLKEQAASLKKAMPLYPTTRDKGEVSSPPITREAILAIEDRGERERAIAEHLDLF